VGGERGPGRSPGFGKGRAWGPLSAAFAIAYAATVGRVQLAAVRNPADATTVRHATGAGVRGVIPLQAALIARTGTPGAPTLAATLLALGPLARLASKVVSPT
jgi:4-hydroxybenzoate polyprenyltransferase